MSRIAVSDPFASASLPPMPGKVLMFVRNSFEHDSRVLKQARTLIESGVDVRLIAVATPGLPSAEVRDGLRIERVDDDPVPTRIARRALAWLARQRGQAGGGSQRGAVIGLQDVQRSGSVALALRAALRVHLRLALWRWWRLGVAAAASEPADVYVAHDLDTLPIAVRAKSRYGGHVLYDSHELWIDSGAVRGRMDRQAWRLLERRLIRHADAVVTVSDAISHELSTRYRIAPPRVVLNTPYDRPGEGPRHTLDLRARLGIPSDRLLALNVGGIAPNRGMEELIDAAGRLKGVVVVLMGPSIDSSYRDVIRKLAQEAAGDAVVLAPPVPGHQVVAYAKSADIGLVPLRATSLHVSLTLPNKLFECIAAGLPIVAGDLPELRRIVGGYELGLVCDAGDPPDLARAVRELADDPQRRATMAANSRRAATDFSWERQRQVLIDSFSALAQSS